MTLREGLWNKVEVAILKIFDIDDSCSIFIIIYFYLQSYLGLSLGDSSTRCRDIP